MRLFSFSEFSVKKHEALLNLIHRLSGIPVSISETEDSFLISAINNEFLVQKEDTEEANEKANEKAVNHLLDKIVTLSAFLAK